MGVSVTGVVNAGKALPGPAGVIASGLSAVLGGGSSAKYSSQLTLADIQWMFANASPDQMRWLQDRWNDVPRDKPTPFPSGDASAFYHGYSGGSDKKITSQAGVALAQNTEALFATMKSGGATAAVGGIGTPTEQKVGPSLPGVKETLAEILDNLKKTGQNILGATLTGAAEGAKGSTQGAQTGSAAGGLLSNTKATVSAIVVIIIVAVLIWYFVFKRE
jgi:hypothetical protein